MMSSFFTLRVALWVMLGLGFGATAVQDDPEEATEDSKYRQVAELKEHDGVVMCLAFHAKKPLLATAGRDGTIKIWDTKKWKSVASLRGHESERGAICFSPNGRLLAAGGHTGIKIWAVGKKWKLVNELKLIQDEALSDEDDSDRSDDMEVGIGSVGALQFSPDNRLLFAGGDSKTIHVWETKTWSTRPGIKGHEPMKNDPVPELPEGTLPDGFAIESTGTCEIEFIAFPRKGKVFASGGRTHALRLWQWKRKKGWASAQTFEEKMPPATPTHRMDAGFSPDGKLLAVAVGDGRIEVIDAKKGKLLREFQANQEAFVTSVEFAADGASLFATGQGLKVWSMPEGELLDEVKLPSIGRVVRRSNNGKHLAVSCEDGVIRIFEVPPGD